MRWFAWIEIKLKNFQVYYLFIKNFIKDSNRPSQDFQQTYHILKKTKVKFKKTLFIFSL